VRSVREQVPENTERRDLLELILAAADREARRRHSPKSTHWEPSDSPELGWRVGSTPSSDRQRRRLFLPELHRRPAEERDQSAPREELEQLAPSPEPTQPFSSEELRRLAPGLDRPDQ
jgi:hypothetical protein